MGDPLISLCMIVKNEAETLPSALEHFDPLVDEFCIVDTGSTDGTLAIKHPKLAFMKSKTMFRPEAYPDDFDFSVARNEALDMAHGTWTMAVDPEYRMHYNNPDEIRGYLSSSDASGYDAVACPVGSGDELALQYVILRREKSYRYAKPIHEVVRFNGERPARIYRNDRFHFDHLRVPGQMTHDEWIARREWYLRLMLRYLQHHPDDITMHTLALQEFINTQKLDTAMKCALHILKMWGAKEEAVPASVAHVMCILAGCYASIGDYAAAVAQFKGAMRYEASSAKPMFFLGEVYRFAGDLDSAEYWLKRALECKPPQGLYTYDNPRFREELPARSLAMIAEIRKADAYGKLVYQDNAV